MRVNQADMADHPDSAASAPVTANAVVPEALVERLGAFLEEHPGLMVLTGAGCSTDSGIPDYRDARGAWKRAPPVQFHDFVHHARVRRRYWVRSLIGWPAVREARPNAAHNALARLQRARVVSALVTQNVDGLHQRAGSEQVIDLHGRLDTIVCLQCGARSRREDFQRELEARNPEFAAPHASPAPDGDADVPGADFDAFRVPDCPDCAGTLKPDVVFFGEAVPRERVDRVHAALAGARALLVVGSSLMVYSGYRFARAAHEAGKPLAALNMGRTRADAELALKLSVPCAPLLDAVANRLEGS